MQALLAECMLGGVCLCLDRCCSDMIRPQAAAALGEVAIAIVG